MARPGTLRAILFLLLALFFCSPSLPAASSGVSVPWSQENQVNSSRPEIREINVRLAADEELEDKYFSRERVESLLREVSRDFERLFGLRFRWQDWTAWKSPDEARSLEGLAEDLDRTEIKRGADILIAVTGQPGLELEYTGFSLFRVGTVVVIYTPDRYKLKKLLLHELGHVFGAVHVPSAVSIMSCGGEGQTFDPENRALIQLGRQRHFRPFGFPFPKDTWSELEKIYLGIRQRILEDKEIKKLFEAQTSASGLTAAARKRAVCLADCSLMLAQLQLERGDYRRAIEFCREALVMSPGSLEGLNLQAIAWRRSGQIDRAIEIYQAILKENPQQVRVLYNLGIAYGRQNRLAEAEEIYLKVIGARPDFIEAHNNLGEIYLRQDRLPEAEKEFQKAVELHDEFALAYANLAEVYLKKNDPARAREYVDRALELDPGMTAAYNMKGNILRLSGKLEEAIRNYQQALELNPKNEKALYNLGLVAADLKRPAEAREYFLKAIEADPMLAEAYAGLGLSYLQEKNWDEAIRQLRRAGELGYRSPVLNVNLSYAYLNKKDWPKAEAQARQAIQQQPDLATAYNNLGIALAQQNRLEEAREALGQALRLSPLDREQVLNLAAVEFTLGHEEQALELFLKALALDPNNPGNGPIYNNLAVLYYRRGQYEKSWDFCLKALQSGVRVAPDLVEELRKRIKKY